MEKTFKTADLLAFNGVIGAVKNKGLQVGTLVKLVKLKAELKQISQNYQTATEAIMDKFEVVKDADGYEFSKHPKLKEIQADLKSLGEEKQSLTSELNFAPWKELADSTSDLSVDIIQYVAEYIAKNE